MTAETLASFTTNRDVEDAMSRLKILEERLHKPDVSLNQNDVASIDAIIKALEQLDFDREKEYQNYETQSITVNMLRHKLAALPEMIKADVERARNAARSANEKEIQSLKNQLTGITTEIEKLEEDLADYDEQNSRLWPERERLQLQYEEGVNELNAHMSQKAGKQIALNELRDEVRNTNQQIVDMEEDMIMLKQDLIRERAEARIEKTKLQENRAQVLQKLKEQELTNRYRKVEVDEICVEREDRLRDVTNLKQKLLTVEKEYKRLKNHEAMLNAQIDEQQTENKSLVNECSKLRATMAKDELEHENRSSDLQGKIDQLDAELQSEQRKQKLLAQRSADLSAEIRIAQDKEQDARKAAAELEAKAKEARENLARTAEEAGEMRQENETMTLQLNELKESHKIKVAQLNNDIDVERKDLFTQRQERMQLANQRGHLQRELEEFRRENQQYIAQVTYDIRVGKERHERLAKEGAELQAKIKQGDNDISRLKNELLAARKQFQSMKKLREGEVTVLQKEIASLNDHIETVRNEIEERAQPFEELKQQFEQQNEDYENLKKSLIARRNKQQSLTEQCFRTKHDIERALKPLEELEGHLADERERSISETKRRIANMTDLEQEIYITTCKLRTVELENGILEEAISELTSNVNTMKYQVEQSSEIRKHIQYMAETLQDDIDAGFQTAQAFEEEMQKRDTVYIEKMSNLHDISDAHGHTLGDVTGNITQEIDSLTQFLNIVDQTEGIRPTVS